MSRIILQLNFVVHFIIMHAQDAVFLLHCYLHKKYFSKKKRKTNRPSLLLPPPPLKCVELISGPEEWYFCNTQTKSLHLSVASNEAIIQLSSKFFVLQKYEKIETHYWKVTCPRCAGETFAQLITEHYKDWSEFSKLQLLLMAYELLF